MVDELIAARPHPISSRLAVNVGNTLRDATLVQAHLATAAEGLPRIEDSWVLQLSPLARHEQADLIRAVRMRRTLPPDVALKQIRRIIGQRPRLPMLRVLTADLLKSQQKFRDAKIALDFHNKREEQQSAGRPRSRAKNYIWYGMLGSKELVQK